MVVSAVSHQLLKRPVVAAMFNSTALTDIIGQDGANHESIYEGWHKPERITVNYPYITYRISWYPGTPQGFLDGTMVIDIWDESPQGNDTRRIESICTILTLIYDGQILIDGIAVVRTKVVADEWVQEETVGNIHRQVSISLRTIDVFTV